MKQKRKDISSSPSSISSESTRGERDEEGDKSIGSSSGKEPIRRRTKGRGNQPDLDHIRVDVLEFEGRVDPNEFLEWLHNVKTVFNYKESLKDKKIKLVAVKL